MANRDFTLPGPWADNADTTIPGTPTQNTPYRDESLSDTTIKNGWPFGAVVNSANFNQYLYLASLLLGQVESQGIPSWSALTTYVAGGLALGSDARVYQAIDANTNNDPVDDTSNEHWNALDAGGLFAVSFTSDANGTKGYIRCGSAGAPLFMLQWAHGVTETGGGEASHSIAWPAEFPVACSAAWASIELPSGADPNANFIYQVTGFATTGITVYRNKLQDSSTGTTKPLVIGIGH
jgi:hypothetical protein